MRFLDRYATVLVLSFAPLQAFAAFPSFRFELPHDRVVRVEAWDNDLLHFELSTREKASDPQKPIWVSPMIGKRDYAGAEAREILVDGKPGVETSEQRALIDRESACVEVTDLVRGVLLHRVCPMRLEQDWKGIEIHAPRTWNIYGLGQYFVNPGSADGDLRQRVLEPGPMGNELRAFSGGANSVSMFPILYLYGQGFESHALLLDSVYRQRWDFGSKPYKVDSWGDQLRWFVISGPDAKDLRADFMDLSGRPPVPPKSSMGLWVSEFGYDNWDEVKHQLALLDRNGFPIDGFALDIQWFGGTFFSKGDDTRSSRFGTLSFDEGRFPRAREEIRSLKDRDVQLMPIEESYVSYFLEEHRNLWVRGFLAKDACDRADSTFLDANPWWGVGGMIDWTNPAAGDYWHDLKRQPLIELGLTSHWTDLGEPEMFSSSSCYHGFPEIGKRMHGDIHNVFNLRWLESIARGYERNKVRERPFMMSRSGIIGVQRTGAGMWSGDIAANMGALTAHLNIEMHMAFAGVDYYGSDVGGFHRRPDTLDGDADELFTQWFANASLFDFPLRSHVWNLSNTLHTSPAAMGHRPSNLANVRQRYELFPYVYSLAHRAHRSGSPIVTPMAMEFQDDLAVRAMGNEKMLGPSLLAAVVAKYGELHRDVYLPKGQWASFHGNEWFDSQGETFKSLPVRRDGVLRLPLFARAGAILPMARVSPSRRSIHGLRADGGRDTELRVRVFGAPEASEFTLIEDDGKTVDYRAGRVAETRITQALDPKALIQRVRVGATSGSYDGMPERRDLSVELIAGFGGRETRAVGASWNGAEVKPCSEGVDRPCWRNTGKNVAEVFVPAAAAASAHSFEIRLEPAPATTAVYFACHQAKTDPGVGVYVTGSLPELGAWDPKRAVKLEPTAYPAWTGVVTGLPIEKDFRWKCIRRPESIGPGLDWVDESAVERGGRTGSADYTGVQESHFP